jgi:hypothetical protein
MTTSRSSPSTGASSDPPSSAGKGSPTTPRSPPGALPGKGAPWFAAHEERERTENADARRTTRTRENLAIPSLYERSSLDNLTVRSRIPREGRQIE